MPTTRRALRIFLASPSDVSEERTAADEVVSALNRVVRENLGWQLELSRWEERAPAFGRPQDLINPLVDDCDVFVGLLWRKWGQPSGAYSSGFLEEFERARKRRKETGTPEICIAFKNVDPAMIADPGDELKKVLDFRKAQENSKEILFATFNDVGDWKVKLNNWLLEQLLAAAQVGEAIPQKPVVFPTPTTTQGSMGFASASAPDAAAQLGELSVLLRQIISNDGVVPSVDPEQHLTAFHVARLYLCSASLLYDRYTTGLLGTHEVNLLYGNRQELRTTAAEDIQLFRTLVEDDGDVKPGWFWFRETDDNSIADYLVSIALNDASESVRARALDLLTGIGFKGTDEWWRALSLDGHSIQLHRSVIRYLSMLKDERTLEFVRTESEQNPSAAWASSHDRLDILLSLDAGRAFSEIITEDQELSNGRVISLVDHISEVSSEILLRGAHSSQERMRVICVDELARRGALTIELARGMTTDSSLAVRAFGFHCLAVHGVQPSFREVNAALRKSREDSAVWLGALRALGSGDVSSHPDAEQIFVSYFSTKSREELLSAVDWYSTEGRYAYKALALLHFNTLLPDVRQDLADGFSRLKERSTERLAQEYGESWQEHAHSWRDLDEFIESRFVEAALLGLANHAQPSDVDIARRYITRSDTALLMPAVNILAKFGTPDDVPSLMTVARESYGEVKKLAAAAALTVATDPAVLARELFASEDRPLRIIGYERLLKERTEQILDLFRGLLTSNEASYRLHAIFCLLQKLNRDELADLLKEYLTRASYYYDVVTWLDRLLYAPPQLADAYRRALEAEVGGS